MSDSEAYQILGKDLADHIFEAVEKEAPASDWQNLQKQTIVSVIDFETIDEYQGPATVTRPNKYKFPTGGWECSECLNYNFKGRNRCHRCKKWKNAADTEG